MANYEYVGCVTGFSEDSNTTLIQPSKLPISIERLDIAYTQRLLGVGLLKNDNEVLEPYPSYGINQNQEFPTFSGYNIPYDSDDGLVNKMPVDWINEKNGRVFLPKIKNRPSFFLSKSLNNGDKTVRYIDNDGIERNLTVESMTRLSPLASALAYVTSVPTVAQVDRTTHRRVIFEIGTEITNFSYLTNSTTSNYYFDFPYQEVYGATNAHDAELDAQLSEYNNVYLGLRDDFCCITKDDFAIGNYSTDARLRDPAIIAKLNKRLSSKRMDWQENKTTILRGCEGFNEIIDPATYPAEFIEFMYKMGFDPITQDADGNWVILSYAREKAEPLDDSVLEKKLADGTWTEADLNIN